MIVGDQAADEATDDGALTNASYGLVVQSAYRDITYHVLGLHALLGDLHRTGIRRPQRGHAAPVDPGMKNKV